MRRSRVGMALLLAFRKEFVEESHRLLSDARDFPWCRYSVCLSRHGCDARRGLAIGDQRMDVLNAQTWICLIEANRCPVRAGCEVDELLEVLPAWRRRRSPW